MQHLNKFGHRFLQSRRFRRSSRAPRGSGPWYEPGYTSTMP